MTRRAWSLQMESSPQNERVAWVGCLFLGLIAFAILLTLASVLSRPDSEEEFFEGCVVDLVIVAPFWTAVTFIKLRCRGGSNLLALILSSVAFVLLTSSLLALNNAKYRMRWQRSSNWEPPRGAWRRFSLIEKGATATRPTLSLWRDYSKSEGWGEDADGGRLRTDP
jgi:hypothetical protein